MTERRSMMGDWWSRLAITIATIALVAAVGVATAAEPPPSGPVYPPPGGVSDPSDGDSGRPGGVTFSYGELELDLFSPLMWGPHSDSLPQLAMDGAVDDEGETMSFSEADSDLAGGELVFTGSAELPGAGVFETRATIRTLTPADEPLPMVGAESVELPEQIGGVAVIDGDFKSNMLLEVDGVPAKDFFDAAQTDPGQAGELITSIAGAFYYVPANEPPEASFTWSPETPTAGRPVTFTSTSTDPDGEIVETEWDLTGDGNFDDASGEIVTTSFAEAGDQLVGLRVTDDRGATDTTTATVSVVANEPPEASFTYAPQDPRALQAVTFTSTSTDPDGEIVETEWDLTGDGNFDDATGETATTTFEEGGEYAVSVRVTDDLGGISTATETVVVRSCESGPVSALLREVGVLVGLEPPIRQLNCELLEPLGL